MSKNVYFIGGGHMAEAMIRACLENKTLQPNRVFVTDISEERTDYLKKKYGIQSGTKLENDFISAVDIVVIAVRPQDDLKSIGLYLKEHVKLSSVVLSIVAGVTIRQLTEYMQNDRQPIVRIIPNTLTDTGYGYSGVALNGYANKEDVEDFLLGFGKVQYIDESLIDVFTGFGVAGPNYVYYFIESLADAGVLAGLSRDQAWAVTLENILGSVAMLKKSGMHPRQLLDINNSAGGVGIHLLYELNNSDFAAGLQRSVLAAVETTTKLGKSGENDQ